MQEGLDTGPQQRHREGRLQPAFLRRRRRRVTGKVRQAAKLAFGKRQNKILLLGQHILRKTGTEAGKPLADGIQSRPRLAFQLGALAHKIQVIAFQHPERLGIQSQFRARLIKRVNPREQIGVEVQRAPMGGKTRRHLSLDLLQSVIGMGRGEGGKRRLDFCQPLAAFFQPDDAVLETGRRGGDGGDLRVMLRQRALIGRGKMLRPDAIKRRGAEGRGPVLEKGIFRHGILLIIAVMKALERLAASARAAKTAISIFQNPQ